MLCHVFLQIDKVFHSNGESDNNRKETISLNNLGQRSADWFTQKTLLGWNLDTVDQFLCLPPKRQSKIHADLESTPQPPTTPH